MIKELFLDLETTGTDVKKCGIWQIGGIIRYDRKIKEEFEFSCDIFEDDEVDPEAMKMAGLTLLDFANFNDPGDVYQKLIKILEKHVDRFDKKDKFFITGYGVEFDVKCLRRWFEGMGDKYFGSWFWMPWICVMTLAGQYLRPIRSSMPNFKLETVLDQLKIPHDKNKLHSALYDATMAMKLYDRVIDGLSDIPL